MSSTNEKDLIGDSEEADAVHHRILEMRSGPFPVQLPPEEDKDKDKQEEVGLGLIRNGTVGIEMPSEEGDKDKNKTPSPSSSSSPEDFRKGVEQNYPKEEDEQYGFDYVFLRRFYKLHGLMFLSGSSLGTLLFIFLLLMSLLQEYIVYRVGLIASGYYKVLADKDFPAFKKHTINCCLIILAVTLVKTINQYIQKLLSVTWRKLICRAIHRLYFSDIRYYQLNVLDRSIDNPDQRMTQDVDKFCSTYGEVLPRLLISPFVIVYYCYQALERSGWQGPFGCFCFFIGSTVVNKLIMTPIVRYVVKQERCEGDFRFIHTLVRVNSESIAFHNASMVESDRTNGALDRLIRTQHTLYFRQLFLNFSVTLFQYAGSIFSYLMLAVPIFSGKYDDLSPSDLSVLISENSFVLMYLIFRFTELVDMSGRFADIAGVVHRISKLIEKLNVLGEFWKDLFPDDQDKRTCSAENLYSEWSKRRRCADRRDSRGGTDKNKEPVNGKSSSTLLPAMLLQNVTFSPPMSMEPLISNLTILFSAGESILVSGHSSAGKSSLLRVLRGLWPITSGTIKNYYPPGPHGLFYCPQKPYLTTGSLREQIYFPLKPTDTDIVDDKLITSYFSLLKMQTLLERVGGLDTPVSWSVYDSLSPGEMQRICFLRVFFHRPVIAILDEATSALPLEMERVVYSECQRLGITTISVGHRASLVQYHDKVLTILPKAEWTLEPIVQNPTS